MIDLVLAFALPYTLPLRLGGVQTCNTDRMHLDRLRYARRGFAGCRQNDFRNALGFRNENMLSSGSSEMSVGDAALRDLDGYFFSNRSSGKFAGRSGGFYLELKRRTASHRRNIFDSLHST
jgi:hypothetical protein